MKSLSKRILAGLTFNPRLGHLHTRIPILGVALAVGAAGTARSQVTFPFPSQDTTTQTGGEQDRQGVGAAVFNNTLYIAYTDSVPQTNGNYAIILASNTDGGATFGNKLQVTNGGFPIYGVNNPSLAVYNNKLYLAYNDAQTYSNVISSSDGVNWSNVHPCTTGVNSSVSLAVFNNLLYFGLRNASNGSVTMCAINAADQVVQVTNLPQYTANAYPGIGVFTPPGGQPTLYVGYEALSNDHNINLLLSTDGVNYSFSSAAASDQTSTAPSFAIHNGIFYLGFRTNDGDHKFLYKYTTNGSNWSGNVDQNWTMGGPAALINATNLTGSPYNGYLFNIFTSNDSSHYVWSSRTN